MMGKRRCAEGDVSPIEASHKEVFIAYGDLQAEVDCGIAPLVLEAWKAGIATRQSCEADDDGQVWLQFETTTDLVRFLTIVSGSSYRRGSLYHRALYGYDRITAPLPAQWRYEVVVHDFAIDFVETQEGQWKEMRLGPPAFAAFVSVRFPRRDIATAIRRLQKHNRNAV